ncbi:MAG: hypothetical protein GY829_02185 [Gammaproteobacteria bacterium]|nr:hypothetical protein [Gammaproteobacteria bacterium]
MENGVKALLTLASSHKKYSATVLFRDEDYNIIKGFANEILDPNLDIQIVPIRSQEAKDFKAMGYTLAFEMDSIGIEGERLGFYTAYTGAATTFQRTTFSTTSEQSKGTTLTQVYVKDTNGIVGRKMVRNAQNKIYREAMQQMNKQFTSEIGDLRKNRSKEKSPLIPLVNSQGEAYEYRVILSHAQKEKHLNQDKRVDEVLGSMYASMSDKLETRKINYRVITDLYDDYSRNFEDEPEAFVRIGQNGRYGDLWAVMPEQSKQLVKELTGKRELYVRAELVDLVMGYRKLSIKDSERFQKLPPLVKGVLGVTEKIWQEIVAYGAVQIVIKTPKVLIDNVISNTIMLLRDNVSPKMILDKHLEGIAGLNDYYSTVQEIHDLNIKLQQNPKNGANQSQIAKAHERLRLNPVRPLIEAGIFQSITEEINVSKFTDNSAFNNTRIGKAAVKLTPTFMIPVLKQAFMTKDTWLFNTMMKATQYSDFLARYTKYSFLTETSEFQALEGPAREAALQEIFADIVEDYVNYDVPQNKKMQYVNDMGGMRFTKYFLRTQRVITKKWQQQPVNMAISWGLQSTFGDVPDITDSFIFTSDIMGKVNGPVGLVGDAIIPKGAELVGLI